ncbi:Tho complex subunit 7-domain-containing protein [Xylariaceae sp. FL0255]|nr:Tho complex subunit 7-domain-containing protein [Xylariaceae sp. FL0255]
MATQQFGLLEEREETELHKTRLLAVEERPFKRLTKRLIAPGAFTNPNNTGKLATPPPDSTADSANSTSPTTGTTPTLSLEEITALKEDITLDFAAFDSAIARLQLLSKANEDERAHYAESRARIQATMENVREHNASLRVRLSEARATLSQRRKFDDLADKITNNRMLRARDEQAVNLAKLAEECEELKRESEAYGDTWRERRAQFERLVDEGRRLRALIRDEKEEVERREGMDSDAEDGETEGKGSASGNATPHPSVEGGGGGAAKGAVGDAGNLTPRPGSVRGDRTPRPDSPSGVGVGRDSTPAATAIAASTADGDGLKPLPDPIQSTPLPDGGESQQPEEKTDDVEMSESAMQPLQTQDGDTPMPDESQETQEAPQITVDTPVAVVGEEKMDLT